MEYEVVIGLEVHAQLLTQTKIFCGCSSAFGAEPNTHGCPVCLGMPGALPVLNRKAVELAMLAGMAVGCTINKTSIFARKNYFYPDSPKGYQISQYDQPLCSGGYLDVVVDGVTKRLGITRIHLEEDAGKLVHDLEPLDTLFDVNRCGSPLAEIVSEPDMRSPAEAYAYLTSLKQILRYLGVSDCNMEEANLRCDANISLRPFGQTKLGTKTELKNMNSFRNVEKALEYEIYRQKEILDSGGTIIQATYLWDASTGTTHPMRTKEDAHDYRYFPDPDLMPIVVTDELRNSVAGSMVELPVARRSRFVNTLGLTDEHAGVITEEKDIADYYEALLVAGADAKQSATWVMTEVLRLLKEKKCTVADILVSPERLGKLIGLVSAGTISASAAKAVFDAIEKQNKEPDELVRDLGLAQISDSSELEKIVDQILESSAKEIERFKAGDAKLMGFFVGQVMKLTKGKGNPKEINRILMERLS